MNYKYGNFKCEQIKEYKAKLHKELYWLLLYKDPETKDSYNIDFNKYFIYMMKRLNGFNALLFYPPEMVGIMSSLEAAFKETKKSNFDYKIYRKLILDAHNMVDKINEGDD